MASSYLPSCTWGTYPWTDKVVQLVSKPKKRSRNYQSFKKSKDSRWFEEILVRITSANGFSSDNLYAVNPMIQQGGLSWDEFPAGIHPKYGHLEPERSLRKCQQVENLIRLFQQVVRDGDIVVEFCAGSGYVALPLAAMYPNCHFIILDKKGPSLDIAHERIAASGLANIEVVCRFVDDWAGNFDIGIALHACGEATDMVQNQCLKYKAAYLLAPCCIGKLQHSSLPLPRSNELCTILKPEEYNVLAKAADFGHGNDKGFDEEVAGGDKETRQRAQVLNQKRRVCKSMIERDRNLLAEEQGYQTVLYKMHPESASSKHDMLLGIPPKQQLVSSVQN